MSNCAQVLKRFALSSFISERWLLVSAFCHDAIIIIVQQLKMSNNPFHELDSRMGSAGLLADDYPAGVLKIFPNLEIKHVLMK